VARPAREAGHADEKAGANTSDRTRTLAFAPAFPSARWLAPPAVGRAAPLRTPRSPRL